MMEDRTREADIHVLSNVANIHCTPLGSLVLKRTLVYYDETLIDN